ncbi:MAG: hypothetical protein IPL61_01685 [Myxococcales bacterium]|nr:hypothetical protein [Myxococcales bacterium]
MVLALLVGAAGCSKNVPQDSKTGEDGRTKGAKEMKIENNEARARGIVTYPGGDRVDWLVLDLPKDKVGTLSLRLKWTPPRPGLDLSFEVSNEYNRVLASAKPNKRKRSRKTTKNLTIENAHGKLYIQIYASERGDAGKYTLTAEWKELNVETFDWLAIEVLDPPKLPAVPEPEKPCDPTTFDKKNPACLSVCPIPMDPAWPACAGQCPTPPDPNIPACLKSMPCPNPPERKFAQCKPSNWPPCDPTKLDPNNPNCDGYKPPDRVGEVTDVQTISSGVQITINVGTDDGVDKGWKGVLLDANDKPIRGSDFKLSKVTKKASIAKVKLDASKLIPNNPVRLSAP